jgi:hypothetical protein
MQIKKPRLLQQKLSDSIYCQNMCATYLPDSGSYELQYVARV